MTPIRDRRVAVVTGASAGVGRATAVALAAAGFDVALVARGAAGLAAAAAEVERQGRRALAVVADAADHEQVEAAADRVEAELGEIDLWVNNAMTTVFAPVAETSAQDLRRAVEVTFLGQVWGTMAALSRMRPRDRGSIVNVGSALAFVGIPLQSAYCASKFACRGFFQSTRAELIHDRSNVRLSMVHLPAVDTPQFGWCRSVFARHPRPVAPIYRPEVAARAIVAAALNGRPEKVLGSWNKLLVTSSRFVPAVASHFAARGAWEEQLTDLVVDPGRRVNLHRPLDDEHDRGMRGIFGHEAHGFFTPSFLATLPKALRHFLAASASAAAERLRSSSTGRFGARRGRALLRRRPSEPPRSDAAERRA